MLAGLLMLHMMLGAAERVAVMPLIVKSGVQADVAMFFSAKLQESLHRLGHETIGMDDIQAILGIERINENLGCDDPSCLAELADLLGAHEIIHGHMGRVEQSLFVSLKRLRRKDGKVLATLSKTVAHRHDIEVFASADLMIRELYEIPKRPASAQSWLKSKPWDIGLWSSAGVTAALGVGFGIAALNVSDAQGFEITAMTAASLAGGLVATQLWRMWMRHHANKTQTALVPTGLGLAVVGRW
jgi:hypothetical protein